MNKIILPCYLLTTAIHGRKYRVSSDPRSQAAAGMESIRAGDHLRTPYAVVYFFTYLSKNNVWMVTVS